MTKDYESATLRAANTLYDELGEVLTSMAEIIEAQQKKIGELQSGYDMVSTQLVAEHRNNAKQLERIRELEAKLVDEVELTKTCANLSNAKARAVLHRFYRAPLSMSSVQPVLDLAVELNPSLKGTR